LSASPALTVSLSGLITERYLLKYVRRYKLNSLSAIC